MTNQDEQRKRDEEAAEQFADGLHNYEVEPSIWREAYSSFIAGRKSCRDTEVKELRELCDKMSLNSLKIEIERDEFREQLRVAVECFKMILDCSPCCDCGKCKAQATFALQKIEAMKGGGDE